MTLNELLIVLHTKGFRDELSNIDSLNLIKRAYQLGKLEAVNEIKSETNEDILKQIYEG